MTDALVPLVVGFMLTTVFGGALGWFFQNRSWQNQNEARLREDELRRADNVCQSLSSLLDKRLYRMLRLFHALRATVGSTRSDAVEERLRDYDAVLFEWNDALSLHLALVGTYFGDSARRWLDDEIYVGFRELGLRLEARYRALGNETSTKNDTDIQRSFAALNDQVYRFGLLMMTRLRDGKVGRNAPDWTTAETRER
jgi:hypothetical protein